MILFTSRRVLGRAENITAVYNAYKGEKKYTRNSPWRKNDDICNGKYDLIVTDEFLSEAHAPVIMIGHGIVGGKTYGLDQPHPYHNKEGAKLLTYVITQSEDTIELAAKQSGVDVSQVLPLGMPRTDAYIGKKKGDGGTGLTKRVYLYTPTFATWQMTEDSRIFIDNMMSDDEVFIIKKHMIKGNRKMNGVYNHTIEISPDEPTTPYLIDCDVLITDYSSTLFDAHILGKPVVLFEKDKEAYLQRRGMCRPYPSGYAGRHTTNERELIRIIREAREPLQADIDCLRQTASACDGHSTERIIKLIEGMLDGHEKTL